MKKSNVLVCLVLGLLLAMTVKGQTILFPEKDYKDLFIAVQMNRVFPDNKTFADATPRHSADTLRSWFQLYKQNNGFQLDTFVTNNFQLQTVSPIENIEKTKNVVQHIEELWTLLERQPIRQQQASTLIPLPHPYIVPGGRFQEVYYWDSYFTMLGLQVSGKYELMEHIIDNFAYLIDQYGHIPNGNRSYFLSRSQPPYFSL
ncbi:MAG: hypothetical protein DI598_12570, partial [Pseudopedobacter saltans]